MAACESNVAVKQETKNHLIMLKKDERIICRAQCGLNVKMPISWNIKSFILQNTLENLDGCNRIHIYPAAQNKHEEKEWGIFLRYLRDSEKVAIVRSEPYKFYILPPDKDAILDCAKVVYVVEEVDDSCDDQNNALSASGEGESQRTNLSQCQKVVLFNKGQKNGQYPESQCTGTNSALNPNIASIHPSFLENLGRAHDWIFGAIAELVDNSRDASAKRLAILIQKVYYNKAGADIPVLSIVDDGSGMTYEDIQKMVSLGRKKLDKDDLLHQIGRFGTGFKTGAMRLGKDALVLTQTAQSRSIAFLSQSLNEGKDHVEIPIISYKRRGQFMELDTSIQSKSLAKHSMKAIKEFSPFDKFIIGELFCRFDRDGTGTQIYIWNLDRWGSSYTLEWEIEKLGMSFCHQGDICTRHRQVRTRPGQVSQKVPVDYSLQAYLGVICSDPRMKIYVQGSKVKARPLEKFLSKTVIENGVIMGKNIQLVLGRSQLEWEQANCGIFLYWHGRLIEAYKRVGGMVHSADVGRGVIGVVDVSNLMDGDNEQVFVHSNKQGFLDCEPYSLLVEWLSGKVNAYCDRYVDPLHVKKDDALCKPDANWVQCDKCKKWRLLDSDVDTDALPPEWFCFMEPFKGTCDIPEQLQSGVVTVSTKRSGYERDQNSGLKKHDDRDYSEEDEADRHVDEATLQRSPKRMRRSSSKKRPRK